MDTPLEVCRKSIDEAERRTEIPSNKHWRISFYGGRRNLSGCTIDVLFPFAPCGIPHGNWAEFLPTGCDPFINFGFIPRHDFPGH